MRNVLNVPLLVFDIHFIRFGSLELLDALFEGSFASYGLTSRQGVVRAKRFVFLQLIHYHSHGGGQVESFTTNQVVQSLFIRLLLRTLLNDPFCAKLIVRILDSAKKQLHDGLFFLESDITYLLPKFDDEVL